MTAAAVWLLVSQLLVLVGTTALCLLALGVLRRI